MYSWYRSNLSPHTYIPHITPSPPPFPNRQPPIPPSNPPPPPSPSKSVEPDNVQTRPASAPASRKGEMIVPVCVYVKGKRGKVLYMCMQSTVLLVLSNKNNYLNKPKRCNSFNYFYLFRSRTLFVR